MINTYLAFYIGCSHAKCTHVDHVVAIEDRKVVTTSFNTATVKIILSYSMSAVASGILALLI